MAKLTSKLQEAADKAWRAWLKWGPVDDGTPEGFAFEVALMEMGLAVKRHKFQTSQERAALADIVNAADCGSDESIREAIARARKVLDASDLLITEEEQ